MVVVVAAAAAAAGIDRRSSQDAAEDIIASTSRTECTVHVLATHHTHDAWLVVSNYVILLSV